MIPKSLQHVMELAFARVGSGFVLQCHSFCRSKAMAHVRIRVRMSFFKLLLELLITWRNTCCELHDALEHLLRSGRCCWVGHHKVLNTHNENVLILTVRMK